MSLLLSSVTGHFTTLIDVYRCPVCENQLKRNSAKDKQTTSEYSDGRINIKIAKCQKCNTILWFDKMIKVMTFPFSSVIFDYNTNIGDILKKIRVRLYRLKH